MEHYLVGIGNVNRPRLVLHDGEQSCGRMHQTTLVNQCKGSGSKPYRGLIQNVVVIENGGIAESECVAIELSPHLIRIELITVGEIDALSQIEGVSSAVRADSPVFR